MSDGNTLGHSDATHTGATHAGDTHADGTVDFGHERVSPAEKTRRVGDVFRAVARNYDVMNDIMSLGLHRAMKHLARDLSGVRDGDIVLDLAGGTGDMAARFAPLVGTGGAVVLGDINEAMLHEGRRRLLDRGFAGIRYVQLDAEQLPFADGTFACVSIAFGLRNVARKAQALREMRRVLAPGGRLLILEFSKPRHAWLRQAYGVWQGLWPAIGRAVTGEAAPYRYLVDSIATHPDQETLTGLLNAAGFTQARCYDLLDGIVALHRAVAPGAVSASIAHQVAGPGA